jgi:hypothetical protein
MPAYFRLPETPLRRVRQVSERGVISEVTNPIKALPGASHLSAVTDGRLEWLERQIIGRTVFEYLVCPLCGMNRLRVKRGSWRGRIRARSKVLGKTEAGRFRGYRSRFGHIELGTEANRRMTFLQFRTMVSAMMDRWTILMKDPECGLYIPIGKAQIADGQISVKIKRRGRRVFRNESEYREWLNANQYKDTRRTLPGQLRVLAGFNIEDIVADRRLMERYRDEIEGIRIACRKILDIIGEPPTEGQPQGQPPRGGQPVGGTPTIRPPSPQLPEPASRSRGRRSRGQQ